jgi:hypothetical protein
MVLIDDEYGIDVCQNALQVMFVCYDIKKKTEPFGETQITQAFQDPRWLKAEVGHHLLRPACASAKRQSTMNAWMGAKDEGVYASRAKR